MTGIPGKNQINSEVTNNIQSSSSTSTTYQTVQLNFSVLNVESPEQGSVIYQNNIPTAQDPTVGYYSNLQSGEDNPSFSISPVIADNTLFTVDPYGVASNGLGYLTANVVPFQPNWTYNTLSNISKDSSFLSDRNTQVRILSPLVLKPKTNTQGSNNTIYAVIEDKNNVINVMAISDSENSFIGSSWHMITNSFIGSPDNYSMQQNDILTAPLAVYNTGAGTSWVFTAGVVNGSDNYDQVVCFPDNVAQHSFANNCVSGLPTTKGSKIIGLNVSGNELYILFSHGELYVSDLTNFKLSSSTATQIKNPSDSTGLFSLCSLDDNTANKYYSKSPLSYVQSNIMAPAPSSSLPQESLSLSGIYLCGGSLLYAVQTQNNTSHTVSQYDLPKGLNATSISSDIAGDVFAISKTDTYDVIAANNPILLSDPKQITWLSSLHATGKNEGYTNYPFENISPMSSLSTYGLYLFLDMINNLGDNNYVLANRINNIGSQWFSLGSNFILPTTNLVVGYTDNVSWSSDLLGFMYATDGSSWYSYEALTGQNYKSWNKIENPPSSIPFEGGDSLASLSLSQNVMFALSKNGFVYYNSLEGNIGWVEFYRPDLQGYPEATKISAISGGLLYNDGVFIQTADNLIFCSSNSNIGCQAVSYGEGVSAKPQYFYIENNQAGVPLTLSNFILNVLDTDSNLYKGGLVQSPDNNPPYSFVVSNVISNTGATSLYQSCNTIPIPTPTPKPLPKLTVNVYPFYQYINLVANGLDPRSGNYAIIFYIRNSLDGAMKLFKITITGFPEGYQPNFIYLNQPSSIFSTPTIDNLAPFLLGLMTNTNPIAGSQQAYYIDLGMLVNQYTWAWLDNHGGDLGPYVEQSISFTDFTQGGFIISNQLSYLPPLLLPSYTLFIDSMFFGSTLDNDLVLENYHNAVNAEIPPPPEQSDGEDFAGYCGLLQPVFFD